MHMAISGQSGHEPLIGSSGQQGIPSVIPVTAIIDAFTGFAAAGDTSGAAMSPAMRKTARTRLMTSRMDIAY